MNTSIKSIGANICIFLFAMFINVSCGTEEVTPLSTESFASFDNQSLRNTFANSFREANVNGLNYLKERDGRLFINISEISEMGAFTPAKGELELIRSDLSGARIETNETPEEVISQTEFSDEYKSFANKILEFAANLEFMSYEEGISYLENIEKEVIASTLDEFERISIDEVLFVSKIIVQESHEIALEDSENGRSEGCVNGVNWRGIAQDAIMAGLITGGKVGFSWAVKGAIATTAGGQPWVGGIIGGLAGFSTGFIGAAIGAGTASYIARKVTGECKEDNNKSATLVVDFICLDPLCNERVSTGAGLIRSNYRIDGVNSGVIYFYGG